MPRTDMRTTNTRAPELTECGSALLVVSALIRKPVANITRGREEDDNNNTNIPKKISKRKFHPTGLNLPVHNDSRATKAKQTRGSGGSRVSTPSVRDTEEKEPVETRIVRQRKKRTDAERRDTGGGGATGPQPRLKRDGCTTVRVVIQVTLVRARAARAECHF